jgi:hypothetical protein
MLKKYIPDDSSRTSRIYSNDLYLAAVLHSQGYELNVIHNERRRVTFVFPSCFGALAVREAYRSGKVMVDMRAFRESLLYIRRLMDGECLDSVRQPPEQRSISHDHDRTLHPVAQ